MVFRIPKIKIIVMHGEYNGVFGASLFVEAKQFMIVQLIRIEQGDDVFIPKL